MRLILIILTSILSLGSTLNAQVIGGQQDKLFDLYLLEKYEDCYFKAIKLTENDKYRSDPEPYLYVAMCALTFNDDVELKEAFGDPLKDALKYAAKAKKYYAKMEKKSTPTFAMEDNLEFFDDLNRVALEEIIYHYNEDKYSKAASWGKKLSKVDPTNASIQVLVGANMLLSKNMEGLKLIDQYWPEIQETYKSGDEVPEDATKKALVYGIIGLSKYYSEAGDSFKAKEIIQFGKDLFVDNMKIDHQYENLNP
ncbi:MAG: hypothetical protein ACPGEG_07550 [Salibacteraceae bacterium]